MVGRLRLPWSRSYNCSFRITCKTNKSLVNHFKALWGRGALRVWHSNWFPSSQTFLNVIKLYLKSSFT